LKSIFKKLIFLNRFNLLKLKINFLNKKNIISIYFQIKTYINNRSLYRGQKIRFLIDRLMGFLIVTNK